MEFFRKKFNTWLLPVCLSLFLLEVLLFPMAAGYTYANTSGTPDQILRYTQWNLAWDDNENILPDGSAEMHLFRSQYGDTVNSGNGDKVVAPGTDHNNLVRLENNVKGSIDFVAVCYTMRTDPNLPVKIQLADDENFFDTDEYPLPEGVTEDQVLRAVEGTVDGESFQDFDVSFLWDFYVSDPQDVVDTNFGNRDPLDEMTVGLYIVVEDYNDYEPDEPGKPDKPEDPDDPDDPDDPNNPEDPDGPDDEKPPYITPDGPVDTGDHSQTFWYGMLFFAGAAALVLILMDWRRESKEEE